MLSWLNSKKMWVGTIVAAISDLVAFFYVITADEAITFDEGEAFVLAVMNVLGLIATAVGIYQPRNEPVAPTS